MTGIEDSYGLPVELGVVAGVLTVDVDLACRNQMLEIVTYQTKSRSKDDREKNTLQVDPSPENAGKHVAASQWAASVSHCSCISSVEMP